MINCLNSLKSKPNLLRDKTLVLRILDERLQSHLREKMLALEESASTEASMNNNNINSANGNGNGKQRPQHKQLGQSMGSSSSQEVRICDLEGVTCEPAIQSSSNGGGGGMSVSSANNINGSRSLNRN